MTLLSESHSSSLPLPIAASSNGLLSWVSCNNPFYAISALLVCLGLWVSFGGQAQAAQTWALMAGMSGYTLVLAVTACLLVRYLGVWDDVRTVMLLTVLMFLATSVTFDEVLAVAPMRGIGCFVGGLVFALAVSEAMLRVTRLSLPLAFRVPYYLILALFFLYPVALVPLLDRPGDERLEWALFGFSPAAALISLSLLPAIRGGRTLVRDNGSPWPWAWYPWTLFGVLGFAVMARLALLCWSMQHLALGAVEPYIFGPYFVTPFLLVVAILLLELGLVEGNMTVRLTAMALPTIVTILAAVGHRPEAVYQQFLARFTDRLGAAPLYLSLIASVGFYCYAWWRRVPGAVGALTMALLAISVVQPASRSLGELVAPQASPLLLVATLQVSLGVLRRDPWRCVCGAGCLIMVVMDGKTRRLAHVLPRAYRIPCHTLRPVRDRCGVRRRCWPVAQERRSGARVAGFPGGADRLGQRGIRQSPTLATVGLSSGGLLDLGCLRPDARTPGVVGRRGDHRRLLAARPGLARISRRPASRGGIRLHRPGDGFACVRLGDQPGEGREGTMEVNHERGQEGGIGRLKPELKQRLTLAPGPTSLGTPWSALDGARPMSRSAHLKASWRKMIERESGCWFRGPGCGAEDLTGDRGVSWSPRDVLARQQLVG